MQNRNTAAFVFAYKAAECVIARKIKRDNYAPCDFRVSVAKPYQSLVMG
jgi:hypothetical protein